MPTPFSAYREIAPGFAVAAQIDPDDVPAIAAAGFRSLVCNRPDGEEPGQPAQETIARLAAGAGLDWRFIPISHATGMTPQAVTAMREALAELDGPVLAYCRSGTRSAHLYAAATTA